MLLFATIIKNQKSLIINYIFFVFIASKMFKNIPNTTLSSIMTRMSSSTPILPEASNDNNTVASVTSTDQISSAENLAVKVCCWNTLLFIN